MTDVIPQIITAASTLVAAFGGVLLTQGHQRRLADAERADRRRAELRSHVVAFIVGAREWVSQEEVVVLALWQSKPEDVLSLVNSEAFARVTDLRLTVTTELHHLIGLAGDERVQRAVYRAHDLWLEMPKSATDPVLDRSRQGDRAALGEALEAVREFGSAVTEVRDAAVPLLRVAIVEPYPVRWWQLRRRIATRHGRGGPE